MDINSSLHSLQSGATPGKKLDPSDPNYFALKAQQNLKSVISGRHPKSLPKNSELWHYSKVSTERRNRIRKGHQFWDVVHKDDKPADNTSLTVSLPGSTAHSEAGDAPDDVSALEDLENTTVNSQPKSTATSVPGVKKVIRRDPTLREILFGELELKNKNQMFFGNHFIIVNYNDEILHVDKNNELRCKPLDLLETTDRVKFKMIDLQNPSNPQALKFGDAMWIQCVDPSENGDNSFQSGIILSSKLFGPPELKSVQFDISKYTKHADADADMFGDHFAGRKSLSRMSVDKTNNKRKASIDHEEAMPEVPPTPSNKPPDMAEEPTRVDSAEAKASKRSLEQANNFANLCGEINLIRIIELRKDVQYVHDVTMTDEKATRYNSKQSTFLGKWAIHSAVRNDHHHHHLANQGFKPATDNYVYSMTPIVIQQDLYCMGTTHPNEFSKWPMTSHSIIHDSKHITQDEEQLFNEFYDKNGYKSRPNALAIWKAQQRGEQTITNSTLPKLPIPEESNTVCLRKIVARGFPYDFSVDRKCVWKIIQFEQFSETGASTEKDKIAKKVMDDANRKLKESQQRREGGTIHISASVHQGFNNPALVSGESFSKNLRQMIFKNNQIMENQFLVERRNHESRIEEYFKEKITHVIDKEDDILKNGMQKGGKNATLNRSASSSVTSPKGSPKNSNTFLTASASTGGIAVLSPKKAVANVTIQLKPVSRTPKEGDKRSKSREQLSAMNTKHVLSETAQEIFKSDLQVLNPKQLLLSNADSLTNFDKLSEGEKVLAMHKTFAFVKKTAQATVIKRHQNLQAGLPTPTNRSKVNLGVNRKLEKLLLEDAMIENVLGYKERLEKMKSAADLSEEMLDGR